MEFCCHVLYHLGQKFAGQFLHYSAKAFGDYTCYYHVTILPAAEDVFNGWVVRESETEGGLRIWVMGVEGSEKEKNCRDFKHLLVTGR